ncbi:Methylated-DNA--protein-cysteine methyltransferase [plant metagenome]|uniref:Methylated-DNA--protein-cysteine methyltransferase n=2 Tax=plant metagenome TaxID=1297885 RepID=A0A484U199_9ZZZZ
MPGLARRQDGYHARMPAPTLSLFRLRLQEHDSPVGTIMTLRDDEGVLRGLEFTEHGERLRRLLRRQYPRRQIDIQPGPADLDMDARLQAYFDGDLQALDSVPLALGGTEFQRQVWAALRAIAPGATRSYGELAALLGRPGASRAVGLANGANPIAIIIPCHRVIGADGSMTGFGGGIPRKRWLLGHEARASRGDVPFSLTMQ